MSEVTILSSVWLPSQNEACASLSFLHATGLDPSLPCLSPYQMLCNTSRSVLERSTSTTSKIWLICVKKFCLLVQTLGAVTFFLVGGAGERCCKCTSYSLLPNNSTYVTSDTVNKYKYAVLVLTALCSVFFSFLFVFAFYGHEYLMKLDCVL